MADPGKNGTGNVPDAFTTYLNSLAGSLPAGGGSSSSNRKNVYMGNNGKPAVTLSVKDENLPGGVLAAKEKLANTPTANYQTQDQASLAFRSWNDQKVTKFRNSLELAGYNVSKMTKVDLGSAWDALVQEAAKYGDAGNKVSPWDLIATDQVRNRGTTNSPLDRLANGQPAAGNGPGGLGSLGYSNNTSSHRSTVIDYTDPDTARSIVNGAFSQLLGRDPTNDEIKKFTDALYSYQAKNPSITDSTTNTVIDKETGATVSSATSDKTVNKTITAAGVQQQAEDLAKKQKDYGPTQAATTYMNALRQIAGTAGG